MCFFFFDSWQYLVTSILCPFLLYYVCLINLLGIVFDLFSFLFAVHRTKRFSVSAYLHIYFLHLYYCLVIQSNWNIERTALNEYFKVLMNQSTAYLNDSKFGPPSELIDISAFLLDAEDVYSMQDLEGDLDNVQEECRLAYYEFPTWFPLLTVMIASMMLGWYW